MIRRLVAAFVLVLAVTHGAFAADWATATPESVGIDSTQLTTLTNDIAAGKHDNLHSLLVVRHGKLVWERYFTGTDEQRGWQLGTVHFNAATLHDVRSISKSVVSILFGIARAQHMDHLGNLDAPMVGFFPEFADLQTPERKTITLRHLLSMTPGLAWDESTIVYGRSGNSETDMDRARDRVRFVLERPITTPPGTKWEYNGGTTVVLARIIERVTGEKLDAFAERVLFKPLGIAQHRWLTYGNGDAIPASGLRLLPRDMAKIGLLMLDNGRWQGAQIVPEGWVRDSISTHAKVADRPFGFQTYGYQWWLGNAHAASRDDIGFACGVGWGGQRILIVPSLDLVIVVTAGLYGKPDQSGTTFAVMLDGVLPAVKP